MAQGKVILAGAGPGDPELITLKALRYLHQADVVITDRLVSPSLISQHVKAGATVFFVGKQGGSDRSVPQEAINELLVEQAKSHALVVRLKGGDVSFFSNVLDELRTLVKHEIAYEIIPGVTSASGGAAYAGIPLTARGYATSVRFLTIYKPEEMSAEGWKELADTNDTLVFYMSVAALPVLVSKLIENKISSDKLLAVIEQATTPYQKVHVYNIYEMTSVEWESGKSPSLVIIGKVVCLHEKFRWLQQPSENNNYFAAVDHNEKN